MASAASASASSGRRSRSTTALVGVAAAAALGLVVRQIVRAAGTRRAAAAGAAAATTGCEAGTCCAEQKTECCSGTAPSDYAPTIIGTGSKVVLVTGGAGLVGHGIQAYIADHPNPDERWVFLSSKDGDLRDAEQTRAIFTKYRPTYVIHLAAFVGGLFNNMARNVEFYRYNVLMNDNVMECCRVFKVDKLVSTLSTCVFPDVIKTYPIDESQLHEGLGHPSNIGYATAKRNVAVMNKCYKDQYGCNFTAIIPTNIFGPHDNYDIQGGHVIPGLIHKCFLAKQRNEPFVIWGSGKPLRQFLHSYDLGALAVWVLRDYPEADPIILSPDPEDEVSIGQVAEMVARGMNFTGPVVFDTSKADGQFKKTASNAKLRRYLPDYKFIPLEQGIREACQWFTEHYEEVRK